MLRQLFGEKVLRSGSPFCLKVVDLDLVQVKRSSWLGASGHSQPGLVQVKTVNLTWFRYPIKYLLRCGGCWCC